MVYHNICWTKPVGRFSFMQYVITPLTRTTKLNKRQNIPKWRYICQISTNVSNALFATVSCQWNTLTRIRQLSISRQMRNQHHLIAKLTRLIWLYYFWRLANVNVTLTIVKTPKRAAFVPGWAREITIHLVKTNMSSNLKYRSVHTHVNYSAF